MKLGKRLLIVATMVAFAPAISTMAQFYKPTGDDGITASPRLRQMLNARAAENRAVAAAPVTSVKPASSDLGITASPRLQEQLAGHKAASSTVAASEVASTTATPNDGIAASPRLREQMRGHEPVVQIAPIK